MNQKEFHLAAVVKGGVLRYDDDISASHREYVISDDKLTFTLEYIKDPVAHGRLSLSMTTVDTITLALAAGKISFEP